MIENMVFDDEDPCPTVNWAEGLSDEEAQESLEKVISFVEACGYSVEFGYNYDPICSFQNYTIYLSSRPSIQNTLYILLHEASHMVYHLKYGFEQYMWNYPYFATKGGNPAKRDSKRGAFGMLHEEMDAWRKGIDIAHALQIKLDAFAYSKAAVNYLSSYVKFAHELI
jgi:hypothetical protein